MAREPFHCGEVGSCPRASCRAPGGRRVALASLGSFAGQTNALFGRHREDDLSRQDAALAARHALLTQPEAAVLVNIQMGAGE